MPSRNYNLRGEKKNMEIAVINQSDELKGCDNDIGWMIFAWMTQLTRDVMPEWGYIPMKMYPAPDPTKLAPGTRQMLLISTPDAADVLGYHDVDPHNGLPYIKVFTKPIMDSGGTLRRGPNSISATGSHELCELFGDSGANFWATDGDGVAHAVELSDAVEQYAYNVTKDGTSTAVSNFLRQQWFRSKPENNDFDFMHLCTQPFQVLDGGYDIYMKGGGVHQKYGKEYWGWKKDLKKHPMSRMQKRIRHANKTLASLHKAA